jgi:hypothetical protein
MGLSISQEQYAVSQAFDECECLFISLIFYTFLFILRHKCASNCQENQAMPTLQTDCRSLKRFFL